MIKRQYGEDLTLYDVKDIQEIFKCKEKKAYQIMNAKNFPTMKVGHAIYVTHENLVRYIKQNGTRTIVI